jgi:hypothetical protein
MRHLTLIVLILGLATWQATASGNKSDEGSGTAAKAEAAISLCLKCGEIKGTEVCCKAEGRTNCGGCGLFKGSAGCCKIPNKLCTKCGEIKGTTKCCDPEGRAACGGCGLFKGSAGCCKLDKPKAEGSGTQVKQEGSGAQKKAEGSNH